MTDRELLELAAKAAGIDLYWPEDDPECDWVQGSYPRIPDHRVLEKWTWKTWNPLTDDGDALRLAVKLGMQITIILDGDDGDHPPKTMVDWATEEHINDPCAATRRAIVRVAAEIGKAK
jgi:hypothetical protein